MKVEDLDVFKLAHDLALKIYKTTTIYPEGERFGLISQMRRAAASICMNLMEGAHRISKNEYNPNYERVIINLVAAGFSLRVKGNN